MFGGAYIRRSLYTEGNLRFQIGYAHNGREICVLKSTGLAYSWKVIYVSNLEKCFTESRLEDVDLSKLSHAKTMSIWTEEDHHRWRKLVVDCSAAEG